MSNPTCSATTLITNATQYRQYAGVSPQQQLALLNYAMVLQLNAIGGTNYTPGSAKGLDGLVQDTMSIECGTSPDEEMAARVSIAFANAQAAGAVIPANASVALTNIARFSNRDETTLKMVNLFLTCNLGVHKAYPQ